MKRGHRGLDVQSHAVPVIESDSVGTRQNKSTAGRVFAPVLDTGVSGLRLITNVK